MEFEASQAVAPAPAVNIGFDDADFDEKDLLSESISGILPFLIVFAALRGGRCRRQTPFANFPPG